jgi:hypothetical protein
MKTDQGGNAFSFAKNNESQYFTKSSGDLIPAIQAGPSGLPDRPEIL